MKEKLFIAVILLLCLVPSLGMLLPGQADAGGMRSWPRRLFCAAPRGR